MERTTTTAADITGDVEQNVLARQMIGQRLAPRPRFEHVCRDGQTALPDAGNVAVRPFLRTAIYATAGVGSSAWILRN
jgi:hypothetical protein